MKEIFSYKNYRTNDPKLPPVLKGYLDFYFSFSLEQLISETTRVTSKTAIVIHHVLTNSSQNLSQRVVIDHYFAYCTINPSWHKLNKHNEISIR